MLKVLKFLSKALPDLIFKITVSALNVSNQIDQISKIKTKINMDKFPEVRLNNKLMGAWEKCPTGQPEAGRKSSQT